MLKNLLVTLAIISLFSLKAMGGQEQSDSLKAMGGQEQSESCGYYDYEYHEALIGGEVVESWWDKVWVDWHCRIDVIAPGAPIDGGSGWSREPTGEVATIEIVSSERNDSDGIRLLPCVQKTDPNGGMMEWRGSHADKRIWGNYNLTPENKNLIISKFALSASDTNTLTAAFFNTKNAPWWLCGQIVNRSFIFEIKENGKQSYFVTLDFALMIKEIWGMGTYPY
jgi:hypothetical protein